MKTIKTVNVKAVGNMELPMTYAGKVLHPHDKTELLTVWEIEGVQYVIISGNTFGSIEFTPLSDLYFSEFNKCLKSAHAPLMIDKKRLVGYNEVIAANLPTISSIVIPSK